MASPFDSKYDAIRSKIIGYANAYGIDPNVAIWQLWQENGFKSSGCSGAGACGIAQFISATAARFGVDRSNVDSSLNGWGKYMRFLLDRYNRDYSKALAGYNAGEGNVDKYHGIPPFSETQHYVSTILANAGSVTGDAYSSPTLVAGVTSPGGGMTNTLLYCAGAAIVYLLLFDD